VCCSSGQAERPESQTRVCFASRLKSDSFGPRGLSLAPRKLGLEDADEWSVGAGRTSCL
jgi:hypothetical protein